MTRSSLDAESQGIPITPFVTQPDIGHDSLGMDCGRTIGIMAHLTERWKLLVSGSYLRYPVGTCSEEVRAFFGQSFMLRRNLALSLEWTYKQKENEAELRFHAYF